MSIDDENKEQLYRSENQDEKEELKNIDEFKNIIREVFNETLKEHSQERTHIVNNICIKNKEEEEKMEDNEVEKISIEKYVISAFLIMLVLFAGFYEIFIRIDINENNLNDNNVVSENIEEQVVMVTPVEDIDKYIKGVNDTEENDELNKEKDNVIDSLFAFANREEERELFDFTEESFNLDLNLKEKALSIFYNIKEIFK